MKTILISIFLSLQLAAVDFNKDIKPILAKKCFSCHGSQKQKGKLRLDRQIDAQKVLIQNEGKITFLERISHPNADEIMPPPEEGALTEKEKAILEKWIQKGARYDKHWSFTHITKPIIPKLKNAWINNEIDQFILEELQKNNVNPNTVEFDYKLLKRISFKLNGLPPGEEDFKLFKAGKLEYNNYVEKLLKSPHYGEHMAAFWLDGARYADSNGLEYDNSRPIWPYRDWVIKSFNDNKPYNQFIIEQVAGDLLPESTLSQKIATGFLRCNVTTNEMGSIEEEFKVRYAKDRLNTTISSILGLTISCAECHDHKYDPITQKEYYQLLSYFNNIDGKAVGHPLERGDAPVIPVDKNKYESYLKLNKDIGKITSQIQETKKRLNAEFLIWHISKISSPEKILFLLSKLDAFFSFDESSGKDIINVINERIGKFMGIIHRVEGKHEKALNFMDSGYINFPGLPTYGKEDKFSVGGWINPSQDSKGMLLGKFHKGKGFQLKIEKGKIQFQLAHSAENQIVIQSKISILTNTWSHIAFTYNGSGNANGVNIYINGRKAETDILVNNLTEDSKQRVVLYIAANLTKCKIDDIFLGRQILNEEQISEIASFNSASRLVHLKPTTISSSHLKRLKHYYFEFLNQSTSHLYTQLKKLKLQLKSTLSENIISMVMKEKDTAEPTYILDRGDYQRKLSMVKSDVPDFFPKILSSKPQNRLELTRWLTDKNNPLTARVIANRIWLNMFGRALVTTPSDFGIQGAYPTNKDLLDFLAYYLTENDWNIKKLISLIANSSTFKQSSTPFNKIFLSFYASYPRHRLSTEAIRDQVLFFSAKLNNKLYGPPVSPYQPEGLWEDVTADSSNTKHFKQSKGNDNYRRSIYTFWKRNFPAPSMMIFDSPSRQICTLQRQETSTPLQALVLLNDPQFTACYDSFEVDHKMLPANKIFEKLFYREPNVNEMKLLNKFIKTRRVFIHSLFNLNEFLMVE